jgi:hypothetical protein
MEKEVKIARGNFSVYSFGRLLRYKKRFKQKGMGGKS